MRLVLPAAAALAVIALLVTGCGGSHDGLRVVHVTERDFRIVAPRVVRAGEVRLVVRNEGPVSHELLLVRATGSALPMRADDLTVDEDAVRLWGAVEPSSPGRSEGFVVHLRPGRYILFCNMAGHFLAGMQRVLTVR